MGEGFLLLDRAEPLIRLRLNSPFASLGLIKAPLPSPYGRRVAFRVGSAYIFRMQTILIIALIAAMAATVFFLVRGIVQFLRTTEADLKGDGPNLSGRAQNKAMQGRIAMQAIAVVVVVLLLLLMGR